MSVRSECRPTLPVENRTTLRIARQSATAAVAATGLSAGDQRCGTRRTCPGGGLGAPVVPVVTRLCDVPANASARAQPTPWPHVRRGDGTLAATAQRCP